MSRAINSLLGEPQTYDESSMKAEARIAIMPQRVSLPSVRNKVRLLLPSLCANVRPEARLPRCSAAFF